MSGANSNNCCNNKQMKLSFLIYSYFPYGGQQRDFYRIVSECAKRGHEIDVYAWRCQGEMPEGVRLIQVPVKGNTRTKLYQRYTSWVQAALSKADAQRVIGFVKMPGLDVYFAADPCFAEKADTQRGAYYKLTPRFRHFKNYEEAVFGADSATEVLILSPQQRQAFEHYYPDCRQRLHQLPPGVALDRRVERRDPAQRAEFRSEFALPEEHYLLLQIGSGFRVKGVDRSLHAMASLPPEVRSKTHYMLVGQDKAAPYRRLAKRLGLAEQVTILPGRDDIPRFLAGADLLIHPAYVESAGYVLLEATIAGLPVLTTASCGYSFHVERAQSGEVCSMPFDQGDLDRRLLSMLQRLDHAEWSARGLAYGHSSDLYSLPQAAADFIERTPPRES